jgi:hypothetical protein
MPHTREPAGTAAGRVPVVAVTGHLGAGKTSLVNHLLRTPGARLGVVVNDFGALNVDAALVTGQVDEAAAISGGCVCCLPDAGGLDDALGRLAHPRLRLDAIVVEASGVAEPAALARLIRFSGVARVRPGGVVDVIDAPNHFTTIDSGDDVPARYATASLVVIGRPICCRHPSGHRRSRGSPGVCAHAIPAHTWPRRAPERSTRPSCSTWPTRTTRSTSCRSRASLARPTTAPATTRMSTHAPPPCRYARRCRRRRSSICSSTRPAGYRLKGRVRVQGTGRDHGYLVDVVGWSIHVSALPSPPEIGELVAIGVDLDATEAETALHARLSLRRARRRRGETAPGALPPAQRVSAAHGCRGSVDLVGVRGDTPPRSSAVIADCSSALSSKSNRSRFSRMRSGLFDFGKMMCPCWMCQRSTTCAGVLPWAAAAAATGASSKSGYLPCPSGPHASIRMPCSFANEVTSGCW